jgi:hypothetical protein
MKEINGQLHLVYHPLSLAIRNALLSVMRKDSTWP